MAQYQIPDPNDLMECPYDRTHMVSASSYPYHVMGCRRNHTGREFAICPFNARHEMPKPELRHHVKSCPDRAMIEQELAYKARKEAGGDIFKGCTDTPVYEDVPIPATENWDEEEGTARIGVDPSNLNRVKFRDISSNTLTKSGQQNDNDQLRLPKTSSRAAMPQEPPLPRKPQPTSSVFAYSVGGGRGRPTRQQSPNGAGASVNENSSPDVPYGRGRGQKSEPPVPATGRGVTSSMGGAIGRGNVAPPPGFEPRFMVPNVKDFPGGPMYGAKN